MERQNGCVQRLRLLGLMNGDAVKVANEGESRTNNSSVQHLLSYRLREDERLGVLAHSTGSKAC